MKKLLSLLLTAALLLSLALPAAAADVTHGEKIEILRELEIMTTDDTGTFNGGRLLTRAQLCKILLTASEYKGLAADSIEMSPFPDVKSTHWAAPYVAVALEKGVMQGYSDGTFRPEREVLYEEAVVSLLRLLGYSSDDYVGGYPAGMLALAGKVGVTDDIDKRAGETVSRDEMADLVWNTLNCIPKNGKEAYAVVLGNTMEGDALRFDDLIRSDTKGPYVAASADDIAALGLDNPGIYRDGVSASLAEVQRYDVYCYSTAANAVYITTDRVTGVLEAVLPNKEKPASVTVDGKTYTLTGDSAREALGLDGIAVGETVTLLLDRDGGCAGAVAAVGPAVVRSASELQALAADGAKIYRDGKSASLSDAALYDIYYYDPVRNILSLYSDKVTGRLEAISPNQENPAAVTVGGKSYALSTDAAEDAFGMDGLRVGSFVTLLLDRDGGCAAAYDTETLYDTQAGLAISVGTKSVLTADGTEKTGTYATVLLLSGERIDVPVSSYSTGLAGSPVTVSYGSGEPTVTAGGGASVSGRVDAAAGTIGGVRVAESCAIYDLDEYDNYVSLTLARLDGVQLAGGDVLLAEYDVSGAVSGMILDDVSGDTRSYGVVLSVSEREQLGGFGSGATSLSGSYQYDIGGTARTYSTQNSTLGLSAGPVAVLMSGGQPASFRSLLRLSEKIESVDYLYVRTASGAKYRLADDTACYVLSGSTPVYTSLSEARSGAYTVTAYYDRAESSGGRIRVLYLSEK